MKKLLFGLIATVFLGLSVNAQERLQSVDFGFNQVLPTIGDCIEGKSFCAGGSNEPVDFTTSMVAFSKANSKTITVVFSERFYNENKKNLMNGLVVGEPTAIQQKLAVSLGYEKALVVVSNTYKIRKTERGYETQIEVR